MRGSAPPMCRRASMGVIGQRVDVHDHVGPVEFQPVVAGAQIAALVDQMGHHAVQLIPVLCRRKLEAVSLGQRSTKTHPCALSSGKRLPGPGAATRDFYWNSKNFEFPKQPGNMSVTPKT